MRKLSRITCKFASYLDAVAAALASGGDDDALLPLEVGDHGQVGRVERGGGGVRWEAKVGDHVVAAADAADLAQALPLLANTLRRTFARGRA